LGIDFSKSIYKQLSNIAPTVLITWDDDLDFSFKTYLRRVAKIINREEVAEELLEQYQNRITEVKKKLGDHLKGAEVSIIVYGSGGVDTFWIHPRHAIWFQILDDLGVKIKPIFSRRHKRGFTNLSIETINDYDSDILFILNAHSKSGVSILDKPLIASLNAVKNGRAYVIGGQDVWDVYGPFGVNRLLNLLSKHLLEAAQTF
jgi:iron complex transport system substrate-binding protein